MSPDQSNDRLRDLIFGEYAILRDESRLSSESFKSQAAKELIIKGSQIELELSLDDSQHSFSSASVRRFFPNGTLRDTYSIDPLPKPLAHDLELELSLSGVKCEQLLQIVANYCNGQSFLSAYYESPVPREALFLVHNGRVTRSRENELFNFERFVAGATEAQVSLEQVMRGRSFNPAHDSTFDLTLGKDASGDPKIAVTVVHRGKEWKGTLTKRPHWEEDPSTVARDVEALIQLYAHHGPEYVMHNLKSRTETYKGITLARESSINGVNVSLYNQGKKRALVIQHADGQQVLFHAPKSFLASRTEKSLMEVCRQLAGARAFGHGWSLRMSDVQSEAVSDLLKAIKSETPHIPEFEVVALENLKADVLSSSDGSLTWREETVEGLHAQTLAFLQGTARARVSQEREHLDEINEMSISIGEAYEGMLEVKNGLGDKRRFVPVFWEEPFRNSFEARHQWYLHKLELFQSDPRQCLDELFGQCQTDANGRLPDLQGTGRSETYANAARCIQLMQQSRGDKRPVAPGLVADQGGLHFHVELIQSPHLSVSVEVDRQGIKKIQLQLDESGFLGWMRNILGEPLQLEFTPLPLAKRSLLTQEFFDNLHALETQTSIPEILSSEFLTRLRKVANCSEVTMWNQPSVVHGTAAVAPFYYVPPRVR